MLNIVEWCAFILVVIGVYFIANLNIAGQYFMLMAQVLWMVVGVKKSMGALVFQSFILFQLALYAIFTWSATLPA